MKIAVQPDAHGVETPVANGPEACADLLLGASTRRASPAVRQADSAAAGKEFEGAASLPIMLWYRPSR